jgi:hypothetical protein
MFACDRRVLCVGTTAAIPPGLLLCLLLWWPDFCADALMMPFVKGAMPAERRRLEKLERDQESTARRLAGKKVLAEGLATGRLTLPEAAARARALDRAAPDFPWEAFRLTRPGQSDEERHCREVIEHVRANLPLGPTLSEELALRLEAELQAHLAAGTLRLPQVEDTL